jgi:hypothetical protein
MLSDNVGRLSQPAPIFSLRDVQVTTPWSLRGESSPQVWRLGLTEVKGYRGPWKAAPATRIMRHRLSCRERLMRLTERPRHAARGGGDQAHFTINISKDLLVA